MAKQSNRFDHQQWKFETRVALVVFNHLKENNLTLANKWVTKLAVLRNRCWLRSFHTTQAQASQMRCKKDRRAREPPAEWVNWTKWSGRVWASADEKPIQERTSAHKVPNVLHERNKCWADSIPPQPDTQKWTSGDIMPRATKFDFVGNRSRRRRHAKMETFRGTCLCHTRSSASPRVNESWEVKSWYAPRTE
jgi:hypothetical protein